MIPGLDLNLDLLKDIPRERWMHALGMLLAHGFRQHPDALAELAKGGRKKFVLACLASDKGHGITREEYSHIYSRLARLAEQQALAMRTVQ